MTATKTATLTGATFEGARAIYNRECPGVPVTYPRDWDRLVKICSRDPVRPNLHPVHFVPGPEPHALASDGYVAGRLRYRANTPGGDTAPPNLPAALEELWTREPTLVVADAKALKSTISKVRTACRKIAKARHNEALADWHERMAAALRGGTAKPERSLESPPAMLLSTEAPGGLTVATVDGAPGEGWTATVGSGQLRDAGRRVVVNADYIAKLLPLLSAGPVLVCIGGPLDPIQIIHASGDCCVMPMRHDASE